MKNLIFFMFPLSCYAFDNTIYIDQIGNNTQIIIEQTGSSNNIGGVSQPAAIIEGNYNQINLTQTSTNNFKLNLVGDYNNLTSLQTIGHTAETTIYGYNNTLNFQQLNSGSKSIISSISGDNNSLTLTQSGSGQHSLNVSLTGNGHNINASQKYTGNHNATINVVNAGGAATVNLTQQGSNNQTYSLTQTCAIVSGCATTITQQ